MDHGPREIFQPGKRDHTPCYTPRFSEDLFMLAMVLGLILSFQAGNGIVSGQLKTVEGGPAVAVRVIAIPAPPEQTRPSFGSQYFYQQPPVSTSLTDNQGRYRLTNLPPGRYYIMAGISYYPSTLDPDRATAITVTPDANMANMDFQLQRPLGDRKSTRLNSSHLGISYAVFCLKKKKKKKNKTLSKSRKKKEEPNNTHKKMTHNREGQPATQQRN